jgi:hypothetical protein
MASRDHAPNTCGVMRGEAVAAYRPIDASQFPTPPEDYAPGAAPMLQWIKISDLVVDDSYQRPIYGAGKGNVRKIAAEFRWSKFAPVVVAPIEGGKFAIIDGQHRATAAALLGIESVPAQTIIADRAEQAAAFKSINGQVTRMHPLALHHAALAASDSGALEIAAVAGASGVTILRYPKTADSMSAGETMAFGSIRDGLRQFGAETVITGLQCVVETTNNRAGLLAATILRAIFAVLGGNVRWRDGGGDLLAAFDEIDLEIELEEAKLTRRPKGTATWEILADRLRSELRSRLPEHAEAA